MSTQPTITYEDENAAYKALGLIYGNQDECISNMVALVEYFGGDAFRVYEVDCPSFLTGRGYIIMEDGLDEEDEREVQEDLARAHATEVIWNSAFQLEAVVVVNYNDEEHLRICDKEVPNCGTCMAAFQMREG